MTRLDTIEDRLLAIEHRLQEIEQAPKGLIYRGLWEPSINYAAGDNVTFDGHLWIAMAETRGHRPGDPAPNGRVWTMAVRRGKQGKSAR